MVNIKEIIKNSSLKKKVIICTSTLMVVGVIGFGAFKLCPIIAEHFKSLDKKAEELLDDINLSLDKSYGLLSDSRVVDINSELGILKVSDLKANYKSYLKKYNSLESELDLIAEEHTIKYPEYVDELEKLDTSTFPSDLKEQFDSELSLFKSSFNVSPGTQVDNDYSDLINLYNRLLAQSSSSSDGNSYITFYHSAEDEVVSSGFIGVGDNMHKAFTNVSSLSTVPDFNQEVAYAVSYLSGGGSEDFIKSKFVGKTYSTYTISDVIFDYYTLYTFKEDGSGKSNDEVISELKNLGVESTPNGLFSTVLGNYWKADDSDSTYFVKVTVLFLEQ